jgi:hypothetical protein
MHMRRGELRIAVVGVVLALAVIGVTLGSRSFASSSGPDACLIAIHDPNGPLTDGTKLCQVASGVVSGGQEVRGERALRARAEAQGQLLGHILGVRLVHRGDRPDTEQREEEGTVHDPGGRSHGEDAGPDGRRPRDPDVRAAGRLVSVTTKT